MSAAPLSRSTTGTSATGTTSSGESKQKIRHSTGRGGSGNIKRTKGAISEVAPTSPRAISGREAVNALPQSSKKLNSGRGGSGNIRARPMLKSLGATSTIISQYEDKIKDYERNLIESSALSRQIAGSTGRGGSGNFSAGKNVSSIASTSSAARLNPRYQPRKTSISKDIFSKLKLGKGKKKKSDQYVSQTASTISSASEAPSIFDIQYSNAPSSSRGTTPSLMNSMMSSDGRESREMDDEAQARHRMGLYLVTEQDICEEDDESIYLAYARDDNAGEPNGLDYCIPEESEEESGQSEVEDGASVCLEAVGLVDRPSVETQEWGPQPSTSPISGSAISETFSVHSLATTSHTLTDDEDEEVDPSLWKMRARYSMARPHGTSQYLSPSANAFQTPPRSGIFPVTYEHSRQFSLPSSSNGIGSSSFACTTSPRSAKPLEPLRSQPSPLPSASLSVPHVGPQEQSPTIAEGRTQTERHLRDNHPRLSLLSATDFMADVNAEDDALPPYTPKPEAFPAATISPTRPLPTVPTQVPRHISQFPAVPRGAPLGPRQITHAYSEGSPSERRPLSTVLNLGDWPSPPTSLPHSHPRRGIEVLGESPARTFLHV